MKIDEAFGLDKRRIKPFSDSAILCELGFLLRLPAFSIFCKRLHLVSPVARLFFVLTELPVETLIVASL